MKRVILLLLLSFFTLSCQATEYSKFAAQQYAAKCDYTPHITVKKEHIEQYAQEIGSQFFPYIAYGYGDMRTKRFHKQRISYICLLDCDLNPVWSWIITNK